MKVTSLVFLSLLLTTLALAHGGRTDRCGGHNDRKHGGYHIHKMGKYCACYPDAAECKSGESEKAKSKKIK